MADRRFAAGTLLWVAASVLTLATFVFHNDHFHRISAARQIAMYGELPFQDFFDPGYFGPELSSAALQRLFGDNLLGEALLTTFFVATGTVVVFVTALRASASMVMAVSAAALSLLFLPRAYDYDKVLFYPLGVLLCWRYVERPSAGRVWSLAAGLVAAALFRYDTGVYIAASAFVAMGIVHAGSWQTAVRRALLLAVAAIVLASPALLFVEYHGGLADAVDQMVTYGRRETARTRLSTPGRFSVMDEPANAVLVRWAASADDAARRAAETRHGLERGAPRGAAEDRTWEYRIADPSRQSLRSLLEDPDVEGTGGIDRAGLRLEEPFWARAWRVAPVTMRWLPGSLHEGNADVVLYNLFRLLPLVAAVVLALGTMRGWGESPTYIAQAAALVTMCALLNLFILRYPVGARVGGMAGPAAVLSAWLARRAWNARSRLTRWVARSALLAFAALAIWSVSESADWKHRIGPEVLNRAHLTSLLQQLAASPPRLDALPSRRLAGLVQYLRECTGPTDRILATWFAPEIYFFAQRGFAAGMVTVFGEHWSDPRFESRSVRMLESESAPIVILRTSDERFHLNYPMMMKFLDERYRIAGTTTFGDPEIDESGYTVLIRRDRMPTRVHEPTSMPCFW